MMMTFDDRLLLMTAIAEEAVDAGSDHNQDLVLAKAHLRLYIETSRDPLTACVVDGMNCSVAFLLSTKKTAAVAGGDLFVAPLLMTIASLVDSSSFSP